MPYGISTQENGTFDKEMEALLKVKPKHIYLYVPKTNLLTYGLFEMRYYLFKYLNVKLGYFGIRHRLDYSAKRHFDMIYIHHFAEEHIKDKKACTLLERFRYRWLLFLGYAKEIHCMNLLMHAKNKTDRVNRFTEQYCQLCVDQYSIYKKDEILDFFICKSKQVLK
jgi:hypothetical protein